MKALVAGATGFVGERLVSALLERGEDVVAFSRSASEYDWQPAVEPREGDLGDPESIAGMCEDIDVAYYLIHSLTRDNFADRDRRYAERFQKMASAAGVDRVVYLSGISGAAEGQTLSPHLASRREVEGVLAEGTFDLTVLRAAIIIGTRSASFRIVDDLTERLPFMIVPQWVQVPCQPIAIDDVIAYLIGLLEVPATRGEIYDIGAPDVWSYKSLMELTARLKDRSFLMVPVPVMTPELSSHWLRLTTDVQYDIARPLVESMRYPVTVDASRDIQDTVPIERTSIQDAVERTLANENLEVGAGLVGRLLDRNPV
jgi:dTDP-glucose 4,6-dehydratase